MCVLFLFVAVFCFSFYGKDKLFHLFRIAFYKVGQYVDVTWMETLKCCKLVEAPQFS